MNKTNKAVAGERNAARKKSPAPAQPQEWAPQFISKMIDNLDPLKSPFEAICEAHNAELERVRQSEAQLLAALNQCCQLMDIHELEIPGFVLRTQSEVKLIAAREKEKK